LKEQAGFWELASLPVFLVFTGTQLADCPNVLMIRAPGKLRPTSYTLEMERRASVEEILQKNPPAMMIPYADIRRVIFSKKTSWSIAKLAVELVAGDRRKYTVSGKWTPPFGPEAEKWPNAPMRALASVLEGKMELADDPHAS